MNYIDISEYADIIDTRHIVERIEELDAVLDDNLSDMTDDEKEEYRLLSQIIDEVRNSANESPENGVTLIHESYFVDYIKEYADGTGIMMSTPKDENGSIAWPFNHIDWEAAADDMRASYQELDYIGVTYLFR